MFTKIRRRFRRLYACQWLSGIIFFLVFALVVRHKRQQSVQFSRTSTSKYWQATRNTASSKSAYIDGRVRDWGGVKPTLIENDVRFHIVEKMEDARLDINVKRGEIAKISDVNSRIYRGHVNVHLWRGLCCPKVNSLRQYPLFPCLPHERFLRHTINSGPLGTWYGQRIMGFVHPPITGNFTFHLNAHVFAELWLGKERNAMDVELVAKIAIENTKHSSATPVSHTSRKIYLEKEGKYFFDVLHVMNGGMMSRDHVNVTWLVPGSQAFTKISSEFLTPLLQDESSFLNHEAFLERNDLLRAPSSVIDSEMNDVDSGEGDEDYEGIEIPGKHNKPSNQFSSYFGEDFNIENQKYNLKAIVNVEKTQDTLRGNRYLLELIFRERARNTIVKLSEFVYKFNNSSRLCKPAGITWNRNVTINVILTVKNQGNWAQHFIHEMSRITKETREDHVNIIVVDYENKDIDIEESLRQSSLTNYRVLKRSGAFHKTEAIQSADSTITDPHSIVLLFDLHLRTPTSFFSAIRKHTVEGRMAFTPVLFRLTFCGRPLTKTTQSKGYWETFGFGIFSIFKSDWDRFGGMNVRDFRDKWGGEDWEMIDRVLALGLEVERLRMPGFYHFYHSRDRMWDKS
ncbi:beta-1,4-N-acetylgalactosaminyltransferase 3-like isoform X2 [Stylophora pistillata]|uniref:beta-1,4-N-acetylgalactosaminyltransferase 3-like isoform X2 n=1 Tax=Stylophora pistillata TaxID=50429 RepID=UPI000C0492C2|nr:beta-1,4-N-acetylgalactosaminyltransferase 3-like isoform X2 [Stylophora pistillata]